MIIAEIRRTPAGIFWLCLPQQHITHSFVPFSVPSLHIQAGLAIVIVGASGDLAKKKTYPSLLELFVAKLLPANTTIWGYARTNLTHQELRDQIRPFLIQYCHRHYDPSLRAGGNGDNKHDDDDDIITTTTTTTVEAFLGRCYYKRGASYGDVEAWTELVAHLDQQEQQQQQEQKQTFNRLFYLAVPPNVFGETGMVIRKTAMATRGWSRLIIEKPFGTSHNFWRHYCLVINTLYAYI